MIEGPKNSEGQNRREAPSRSGGKPGRKEAIEREVARRAAAGKEGGSLPETQEPERIRRVLEEEDIAVLVRDVLDASSPEEAINVLKIYAADADTHVTPDVLQRVALERINTAKTDDEREEIRKIFTDAGILSAEARKGPVVEPGDEAVVSVGAEIPADQAVQDETKVGAAASLPTEEEIRAYHKKVIEDTANWFKRGLYPAPKESITGPEDEHSEGADIGEGAEKTAAASSEPEIDWNSRISEALLRQESAELRSSRTAIFNIAHALYGETVGILNEILAAEDRAQALAQAFLGNKLDAEDLEIVRLFAIDDPRKELSRYASEVYEKWKRVVEVGVVSNDPYNDIAKMIRRGEIPQIDGGYILNEITAQGVTDTILGIEHGDIKGPLTIFWEEKTRERQAMRERMAEQAEAALRYYQGDRRRGRKKKKGPFGEEGGAGPETKAAKRFRQQKIAASLKEISQEEEEGVTARAFLNELRSDPEKMREFREGQPRGRVEEIEYQIRVLEAAEEYAKEAERVRNELLDKIDKKREEILAVWFSGGLRDELLGLAGIPAESLSIPPEVRSKLQRLYFLQQEYQNLSFRMRSPAVLLEVPKRTVQRVSIVTSRFGIAKPELLESGIKKEGSGFAGDEVKMVAEAESKIWNDLGRVVDASKVNVGFIKNIFGELGRLKERVKKKSIPEFLLKQTLKIIIRRADVAMGLVTESELRERMEKWGRSGILVDKKKASPPKSGESVAEENGGKEGGKGKGQTGPKGESKKKKKKS